MSLSSALARNDYVGDGATSVFTYSFKIFDDDDLVVTVKDLLGVETTLVKTTDYTVSGVAEAGGGNVTLVDAGQAFIDAEGDLVINFVLTIRRVVTLSQTTDIRNQGAFLPEIHEDKFDFLTMIDQQQQDEIDGSIRLPVTIAPAAFDTRLPATLADLAGATLVVNAAKNGFDMSNVSLAAIPVYFTQATQPADPASGILAIWQDTTLDQINIWDGTVWRTFA